VKQINGIMSTITNDLRSDAVENAEKYEFGMCRHAVNLGDTASKKFVEKLCGVKFGKNNGIIGEALTIGSILSYSKNDSIVWGSGFLTNNDNIAGVKKIYSVRGPKTYQKLVDKGIDCPKIFGDPFFIVPLLYKPNVVIANYDIGIIPHYLEKNSTELTDYLKHYDDKKIKIIDIQTTDIQKFVNEISKCKEIHASSLHGIIFSMAYKIPTKWIVVPNKRNDVFKYHDFFESMNIYNYNDTQPYKKDDSYKLGVSILKSCPFMTYDQKQDYTNKWETYCYN
jgi:pyruvyltransferase